MAGGSAPHMRGIRNRRGPRRPGRGISPAHAGNTFWLTICPVVILDQPRTCGEYRVCRCGPGWMGGSAPHMRGIRQIRSSRVSVRRISPAHAGNTTARRSRRPVRADQPRTCGEYGVGFGDPVGEGGSAPHMRGIPCDDGIPGIALGISPAHAGNTPGTERKK